MFKKKVLENKLSRRKFLIKSGKTLGGGGLAFVAGCGVSHNSGEINTRLGCRPCSKIGTSFPNPNNLGAHNSSEKNGIVYTCKGGFIDLAHLRNSVDWTKLFAEKTSKHLQNNKEFSFKLDEPSRYFVKLNCPSNWDNLLNLERERITKNVSVELGQYFAYTGTTWHEILTWFGYKSLGIYPEFGSSFTCEDNFSNLLGTYIAADVLKKGYQDFDKSITNALYEKLDKLGVQPSHIAKKSSKSMKGKRHFDIGLDGYVIPLVVKGICEREEVISYPVPTGDISEYSFSMQLKVEPREWESSKILNIVRKQKYIVPNEDFPVIMNYIRQDAIRRYGVNVDKPGL